jgi:hypothetical protein
MTVDEEGERRKAGRVGGFKNPLLDAKLYHFKGIKV